MHKVESMQTMQLHVVAMADCTEVSEASGQEHGGDSEMTVNLSLFGICFPVCKVEQRWAYAKFSHSRYLKDG